MLQFEFRNCVRTLYVLCSVFGIDKGVEVVGEILQDEERICKDRFTRIADRGWPHQDNARLYASLALGYVCRDLRDLVLRGDKPDLVKLLQMVVKDVAKLL